VRYSEGISQLYVSTLSQVHVYEFNKDQFTCEKSQLINDVTLPRGKPILASLFLEKYNKLVVGQTGIAELKTTE
jgi:hypothetical protein